MFQRIIIFCFVMLICIVVFAQELPDFYYVGEARSGNFGSSLIKDDYLYLLKATEEGWHLVKMDTNQSQVDEYIITYRRYARLYLE